MFCLEGFFRISCSLYCQRPKPPPFGKEKQCALKNISRFWEEILLLIFFFCEYEQGEEDGKEKFSLTTYTYDRAINYILRS